MSASVKNKQEFFKILESGILLSDGAMGTTLQELGYTSCPDFLNLNKDDLKAISGIHLKYLHTGSEIIQTNSFGSNPINLQSCGLATNLEQANINAVNSNGRSVIEIAIAQDVKDFLKSKGAKTSLELMKE